MKIKIKRFNKNHPLPKHQTEGAAAFDLMAREAIEILPGKIGYVPLNIAVETPQDHFLLMVARSGTHKKGLMLANGMAIGDPDFCGNEDEYKAAYFNFTDKPVVIESGERIAQGTFVRFVRAEWDEVDMLKGKDRGGFGTTGK